MNVVRFLLYFDVVRLLLIPIVLLGPPVVDAVSDQPQDV